MLRAEPHPSVRNLNAVPSTLVSRRPRAAAMRPAVVYESAGDDATHESWVHPQTGKVFHMLKRHEPDTQEDNAKYLARRRRAASDHLRDFEAARMGVESIVLRNARKIVAHRECAIEFKPQVVPAQRQAQCVPNPRRKSGAITKSPGKSPGKSSKRSDLAAVAAQLSAIAGIAHAHADAVHRTRRAPQRLCRR